MPSDPSVEQRLTLRPRTFDEGRVRLYDDDSLLTLLRLPDSSVNVIITCPPATLSDAGARDSHSLTLWSTLWLREASRLLRKHGYLFVRTKWHSLSLLSRAIGAAGLVLRGVVPVQLPAPLMRRPGWLTTEVEFVLWATQGSVCCDRDPVPGLFHGRDWINAALQGLPDDYVVLDPFLPRGDQPSALTVCRQIGLPFIGIIPANADDATE